MSEEKIINLLNSLNGKVDDILNRIINIEKDTGKGGSGSATITSSSGAKSPSEIADEQSDNEEGKVEVSGRLTCPKCSAVGNNINKVDDKETILNYIGGVPQYAKKYYCKKCAHQWK